MVRCHASLREMSATACSSTVTTITHASTPDSAAVTPRGGRQAPARSTAAVATDPTMVSSVR
jgi:hypothetical protein